MIVLGLGSNLGNRLKNLRQALHLISQHPDIKVLKVSPVYQSEAMLLENAPDSWNLDYYNCALACQTSLKPHDLLAVIKKIELIIGRLNNHQKWSPRLIDIDILAWQDSVIENNVLSVPHKHLFERPFALWPLKDLWPDWQDPLTQISVREKVSQWGDPFTGQAPYKTRQILQRIDTPQLVGIVNLTDNSFSYDGVGNSVDQAVNHAVQLYQEGAEIIDIGAEATNPAAQLVPGELQWQKLAPVIKVLKNHWQHELAAPLISIDTRLPIVAKRAIELGVDWINDVSGLSNPEMRVLISQAPAALKAVVMHYLTVPPNERDILPLQKDPVMILENWINQQRVLLEQDKNFPIAPERIIFDIGVGFGKTSEQIMEILKQMPRLKKHAPESEWLVGHSRKSVCSRQKELPPLERGIETLAVSGYIAQNNNIINYLRIHEVKNHVRFMNAVKKLSN